MANSRLFYVLYIDEGLTRRVLDTLRYLANPREKQSAHVTVRGPYNQQHALPNAKKLLYNVHVNCGEVDTFFNNRQSTVYLRCHAPEIKAAWMKPDYPDYNPHLTIYDGSSRVFAERLVEILRKHRLSFDFVSSGLAPLRSSKGQHSVDLAAFFDSDLVQAASGGEVRTQDVQRLPEDDRLILIDQVLSWWARFAESGSDASGQG